MVDPADVWAQRTLALVEQQIEDLPSEWADRFAADLGTPLTIATQWYRDRMDSLERERQRLLSGGIPSRPPRKMPTLVKIAAVNRLGDTPHCVRCWYIEGGVWRDAGSWLERAHVIDRVFDGLDTPANLRPLCSGCHRRQPIFRPGQEWEALAWFCCEPPPWRLSGPIDMEEL